MVVIQEGHFTSNQENPLSRARPEEESRVAKPKIILPSFPTRLPARVPLQLLRNDVEVVEVERHASPTSHEAVYIGFVRREMAAMYGGAVRGGAGRGTRLGGERGKSVRGERPRRETLRCPPHRKAVPPRNALFT
ncbi:hypothetical protein NL676_019939 [Syzygium grande]|nr:hypothetical protein NL676_019939 [Syzygium grande]